MQGTVFVYVGGVYNSDIMLMWIQTYYDALILQPSPQLNPSALQRKGEGGMYWKGIGTDKSLNIFCTFLLICTAGKWRGTCLCVPWALWSPISGPIVSQWFVLVQWPQLTWGCLLLTSVCVFVLSYVLSLLWGTHMHIARYAKQSVLSF
jgi:hypothetical protein